ncbi:MAG: hypothetical protein C0591_10435 [Marinilabiliales bacterium]|nr:MAG: hypothetical protein C0591_10435 [Marinilabiliales bacterium]
MKKMSLLAAIMLFTASWFACSAQEAKAEDNTKVAATDKVEVYYFHNTRRCATCEAVEAVTKSALEETYPEQMKNGTMTFQSLNVEEESNEPLARELHVSGQTLLIVKDGKQKDLTNDAFMYARSNPDKLKEKIVNTITKL